MLSHKVLNKFRRRTIESSALSKIILSQGIDLTARSSIFLDDDLDKIISVISSSSIELERKRIFGDICYHLPTIQYELSNVRIKDSYAMSRGCMAKFPTSRPTRNKIKADPVKEAILSTNILSGLEFGHWVRDSLITEMHGVKLGLPAVGMAREPWPHEPEYRSLGDLPCLYASEVRIGRLVMLDDRGLNAYWALRFHKLRQRLRSRILELEGESFGPLIFLDRGNHGRMRDPTNLSEMRSTLESLGFRTLIPSEMPVSEIGRALRDARIVVSAEGSHLNHLHFFAPDELALITLQDPRRFYAFHKRLTDLYDGRFGIVVGRPDPDMPERFYIDIDRLKRVLDMVD